MCFSFERSEIRITGLLLGSGKRKSSGQIGKNCISKALVAKSNRSGNGAAQNKRKQ
jgi:hypothetical protein